MVRAVVLKCLALVAEFAEYLYFFRNLNYHSHGRNVRGHYQWQWQIDNQIGSDEKYQLTIIVVFMLGPNELYVTFQTK